MLNSNEKLSIPISYNNIAHKRNEYKNDTWEVNERIKFIEVVNKMKGKIILDAGAGNGWDSMFF